MAPPSPRQLAWRRRIEAGLRVVGPALDLVLYAGDQLAKRVDRDELPAAEPPSNRRAIPRRAQRRVGPGR